MLHFGAIPPEISYRVEILRAQRWSCIMDYFESEANGMCRQFYRIPVPENRYSRLLGIDSLETNG